MAPSAADRNEAPDELLQATAPDDPHWTASIFAVWNLIIRPPRTRYSRLELLQDFPSDRFRLRIRDADDGLIDQIGTRRHFYINNAAGTPLACSLFEPEVPPEVLEKACVVYCHGNGSCRLAGFRFAKILLPLGIGLCCFDFSGSGMSGGEFVSLGYNERDDLSCVIDHLRTLGFTRIGLWGYSMGAATVLMHASRDPSIAGLVVDSPFCDLWKLIEEICFHFVKIPWLLLAPVLQMVRMIILQKAKFDICDVSPQAHVSNCYVPAFFLHGADDEFIKPSHTETMRNMYGGEAQRLVMPNQTHATSRTEQFTARATVFLVRALRWESFLLTGTSQRAFSELLEGRVAGSRCRRDEEPSVPPDEAARIAEHLASGEPRVICEGVLRAALALCGPYRGAEYLPCGFSTSAAAAASPYGRRMCNQREATLSAKFSGQVKFADADVELGLCWVRASGGSADGGQVECAVVSTTVASLASVALSRSCPGDGKASCQLRCDSVKPTDFGTLSLQAGRSYPLELRLGALGAVELRVDGQRVAAGAAGPPQGDAGAVYLWIVQWRRDDRIFGGGVQLTLDAAPLEPELEPAVAGDVDLAAAEPEQRMAETLATLCLGLGPPVNRVPSPRRAKLRSGVYMPSDEDSDCGEEVGV